MMGFFYAQPLKLHIFTYVNLYIFPMVVTMI